MNISDVVSNINRRLIELGGNVPITREEWVALLLALNVCKCTEDHGECSENSSRCGHCCGYKVIE